MRKLFEIDDAERSRILEMHENANKKLYLFEAEPETTPEVFVTQDKLFPDLKNNLFFFKKGAYTIDQNSITNWNEFNNFINKIVDYVVKNNKKIKNITLHGSESQTPSKEDNFELAKKRQESMKQYIMSKIPENLLTSKLTGFSSSSHPYLGKTPYEPGVDNPNDKKYLNDQWVKVTLDMQK